MEYQIKGYSDSKEIWHFCYLDGELENLSHEYNKVHGYQDAPDLCGADVPMPGVGEYDGEFYGNKVKIFIAERYPGILGGRICLADETERVEFNRKSDNWR